MNHSLWELSLYNRHRHDELLAESQACAKLSLLPDRSSLTAVRRSLGLRLIAAGRALAEVDSLREANRPTRPAV